jgi:hypothetical protein
MNPKHREYSSPQLIGHIKISKCVTHLGFEPTTSPFTSCLQGKEVLLEPKLIGTIITIFSQKEWRYQYSNPTYEPKLLIIVAQQLNKESGVFSKIFGRKSGKNILAYIDLGNFVCVCVCVVISEQLLLINLNK